MELNDIKFTPNNEYITFGGGYKVDFYKISLLSPNDFGQKLGSVHCHKLTNSYQKIGIYYFMSNGEYFVYSFQNQLLFLKLDYNYIETNTEYYCDNSNFSKVSFIHGVDGYIKSFECFNYSNQIVVLTEKKIIIFDVIITKYNNLTNELNKDINVIQIIMRSNLVKSDKINFSLITCLKYYPNRNLIFTSSSNGEIIVYVNLKEIISITDFESEITNLTISSDSKFVAISNKLQDIKISELTKNSCKEVDSVISENFNLYHNYTTNISCINFSKDLKFFVVGFVNSSIIIYDFYKSSQNGHFVENLHINDNWKPIKSFTFSDDDSLFATISEDQIINIYSR